MQNSLPDEFKYLPVLITNNNIINKDTLLNQKKIEITLDSDKVEKTISIISERKIYSSNRYDITFIEIFPKEDEINDFLEVDTLNPAKKDTIYILQYINEINCIKSYGTITKIYDADIEHFEHNSSKNSGGPILLIENLKIIGINIGSGKGALLRESIKEFYSYISNNNVKNKNVINLIDCYYTINNGKEFKLLHDYIINGNDCIEDFEYEFKEERKKFLKENVEILIDSQPIKFNYKYKTHNNKIHAKFIFKQILNDFSLLFFNCENLESIDLSSYDTTNISNMYGMFSGCSNLKSVNLSSLETNNDINMSNIFSGCLLLKLVEFPFFHKINITNLGNSFFKCKSLESINLCSFNTIKVSDMHRLFSGCFSLKSLNLTSFKTDNVEDMSRMFALCQNLKSLDLSNFNTQNVQIMNDMFLDCRSLITLDLSSFNTKNVQYMDYMFMGCLSLKSINLSSFNTTNVVDMTYMFCGCESLKSLNLSSFNTINVENMTAMFSGCKSLKSVDLSSSKTPKLTFIELMFWECEQLESIDLSSFNTQNVSKNNDPIYILTIQNMMPYLNDLNAQEFDNIFFGCFHLKNIKCNDSYILKMFKEAKELCDDFKKYSFK